MAERKKRGSYQLSEFLKTPSYIHRGIDNVNLETFQIFNEISMIYNEIIDNYSVASDIIAQGLSQEGLGYLDASLKENEIVSNVTQLLQEDLQQKINDVSGDFDFEKMSNAAAGSLEVYVRTGNFAHLDKMFKNISKASKILSTDTSELIAAITGREGFVVNHDLNRLRSELFSIIQKLNGKSLTINQQRYLTLVQDINNLAINLDPRFLTKKSAEQYISKIFGRDLGSYLTTKAIANTFGKDMRDIQKMYNRGNITIELDKNLLKSMSGSESVKETGEALDAIINTDGKNSNISVNIRTVWRKDIPGAIASALNFYEDETMMTEIFPDMTAPLNAISVSHADNLYQLDMVESVKVVGLARIIDKYSKIGNINLFLINGTAYRLEEIIRAAALVGTDAVNVNIDNMGDVFIATANELMQKPNAYRAYLRNKLQRDLSKNMKVKTKLYPNRFYGLFS